MINAENKIVLKDCFCALSDMYKIIKEYRHSHKDNEKLENLITDFHSNYLNVDIDKNKFRNFLIDIFDFISDINLKELSLKDKEEYFEHGEDKTFEIKLPKGSHQLEFNGNDDTEIEKLKIDDNTKVKYKLECLSGGIEVTQVSKGNK